MSLDLKVCPFCGGRPLSPAQNAHLWWISCTACDGEQSHGTREGVIAAWNTRTPDPAITAERDGLRRAAQRLCDALAKALPARASQDVYQGWHDLRQALSLQGGER